MRLCDKHSSPKDPLTVNLSLQLSKSHKKKKEMSQWHWGPRPAHFRKIVRPWQYKSLGVVMSSGKLISLRISKVWKHVLQPADCKSLFLPSGLKWLFEGCRDPAWRTIQCLLELWRRQEVQYWMDHPHSTKRAFQIFINLCVLLLLLFSANMIRIIRQRGMRSPLSQHMHQSTFWSSTFCRQNLSEGFSF